MSMFKLSRSDLNIPKTPGKHECVQQNLRQYVLQIRRYCVLTNRQFGLRVALSKPANSRRKKMPSSIGRVLKWSSISLP